MKKLLLSILCLVSSLAHATPEEVQVVWGYSMAASQLNYVRHSIQRANESQQKYQFVLVSKPGASGKIAVNYAQEQVKNGKLAIIPATNIFFLRTFVYDNSEYTTDEFQLLMTYAAVPHTLITNSSQTLEQVLAKKSPTIAVVQLSGSTHMMAERMRLIRPDLVVVPFNGPPEVAQQVGAGNVDMGFSGLATIQGDTRVTAQGLIGHDTIKGVPPLSKRGFPGLEKYDINFFVVASKSIPSKVFKEMRTILNDSIKNNKPYDDAIAFDIGQPIKLKYSQYDAWYKEQVEVAKEASSRVKEKN